MDSQITITLEHQQGDSGFVWSPIGALAEDTSTMQVTTALTTAVTCLPGPTPSILISGFGSKATTLAATFVAV